jgi:O-acetylhomoserine/O-acetylserine sulfhydrylase-like pyridoxal-dependent enzyme
MMKKTQMRPLGLPGGGSFPVVTPIMPSVVYAAATPDALDHMYENGGGYVYAREGHPNASVLAARIDALEGAQGGIVTGSGMAAVTAVLYGLLRSGDRVVGGDQLYGRSLRMMTQDLPRMGITCVLADACDAAAMRDAITPETRLVMIEIVSNPTLRIADVDAKRLAPSWWSTTRLQRHGGSCLLNVEQI